MFKEEEEPKSSLWSQIFALRKTMPSVSNSSSLLSLSSHCATPHSAYRVRMDSGHSTEEGELEEQQQNYITPIFQEPI